VLFQSDLADGPLDALTSEWLTPHFRRLIARVLLEPPELQF
jgi:hypothetical protein